MGWKMCVGRSCCPAWSVILFFKEVALGMMGRRYLCEIMIQEHAGYMKQQIWSCIRKLNRFKSHRTLEAVGSCVDLH